MRYYFFALFILIFSDIFSQKNQYKVAIAAFYNCENFYDTVHNPLVNDNEFLPASEKKYNSAIYLDKVKHIATVISQIGRDINPDGAAFFGVAEIENDTVLNDLIHHPLLQNRKYKFIHYDSKDERGIDVAFIYNPKYFSVITSTPLFVSLPKESKKSYFTRDILFVQGKLDGEIVNIYVNHWPSRLNGEEKTSAARAATALVCKNHMDSISLVDPNNKFIIMGDLNDDPVSPSVARVLNAKEKIVDVQPVGLYNPWINLYKKGAGTLAYQDAWALFDQIIISEAWLPKNQDGFFYYQSHIFNKQFLVETQGKYKGYPMRTWDGNNYRGGYSDHFPVYIIFLKKLIPENKN